MTALKIPAPATLSAKMQAIARDYLDARKRSGAALLEMARYITEARATARHGEWQLFLTATGTSEGTAKRLLDIHDAAAQNPRIAEAIRNNWFGIGVAGELAQPSTPREIVDSFLEQEQPPTITEVREAKAAHKSATVADLNDAAAFEGAARRFAALGWRLERHGLWYRLKGPASEAITAADLAGFIKRLEQMESDAAGSSASLSKPAEHALAATIREKAAVLGLQLIWEDDKVLLYWPDEVNDLDQMDLLDYGVALEWLDGDALTIAASRAQRETTTTTTAPIDTLTANMAAALESEFGIPVEVEVWPPSVSATVEIERLQRHPCASCGQPSTTRLTIGGVYEPRCDTCTARAQFTALCDQAEALGATINPTAYGDPLFVQVVPPSGYQQTPLKCDADDLAPLVEAWERHAAPAPAAPTDEWVWPWEADAALSRLSAARNDQLRAVRAAAALTVALAGDATRLALVQAEKAAAVLEAEGYASIAALLRLLSNESEA